MTIDRHRQDLLPGSGCRMTRNEFEACEDISPGLAERIQAMVEEEGRHRRMIERRRRLLISRLELAGRAFGLFMAGFLFASGLLAFAEFLTLAGQGDGLRFYVR